MMLSLEIVYTLLIASKILNVGMRKKENDLSFSEFGMMIVTI